MFKKIIISTAVAVSLVNAAGYRVPEQSADSVALLASNIATSFGPDAAYYNPANMMFLPDSRHYFENNLAWFHIDSVNFKSHDGKKSFNSKKFDSLATTFHFVSPEYYADLRFGVSLAVPAGIGMGWDDPDPAFTGKRFKLKVVELNPSLAYRVNDKFAVAAGLRALYTKGRVATSLYGAGERELTGDSIDYGYNLALTYKPISEWSLAATYRSKVNLTLKGNADIFAADAGLKQSIDYFGGVSVEVPLPASLALATSYKFKDTTFMFAYERVFWSKFTGYDFEYSGKTPAGQFFNPLFDKKIERSYKDTNIFRLGIAHDLNHKLRVMGGFTYDQRAAKTAKDVSFDLPDTTSYAYSLGLNYNVTENLELTFGGLYQHRKSMSGDLKITRGSTFPSIPDSLKGQFSDAKIWIIGSGIKYKF